jgi:sucrose phosphorylase
VRPVEGILTPREIEVLVDRVGEHGGYVSYKTNADGSESVYELNISYFDALSDPNGDESLEIQVARFLASQAIMLSLAGVPGVYFHSLFGSRSHHKGVETTGRYRSINREKLQCRTLEQALADQSSLRHRVFYPYLDLIRARASHPAFHPGAAQRVLLPDATGGTSLFALLRTSIAGDRSVLCLHNISSTHQPLRTNLRALVVPDGDGFQDLISGAVYPACDDGLGVTIKPYQVLWLEPLT